jgi:hypothetical protein
MPFFVNACCGLLLNPRLVLSRRILDHLRVGRERMKRRQDSQHGGFGAGPLGQGDAVLDSFPSQFRSVRWYQDEPESWLSRQALMLCVGSAMTKQSIVAWDLETVPDLSAARGCST